MFRAVLSFEDISCFTLIKLKNVPLGKHKHESLRRTTATDLAQAARSHKVCLGNVRAFGKILRFAQDDKA